MENSTSFDGVIERLAAGDEQAAAAIFNRFGQELVRRAHRRLSPQARQKVDPEDVVQSVFRSFFARQADGQFELDGWDSLLGLLVRITLRKCGRTTASLTAACRDIARESPPAAAAASSGPAQFETAARSPTPLEAATFLELMERVMSPLAARDREILTLRMQGYTVQEISAQVGRTERTVHRALGNIRAELQDLLAGERQ